jgi:hypothetical protein
MKRQLQSIFGSLIFDLKNKLFYFKRFLPNKSWLFQFIKAQTNFFDYLTLLLKLIYGLLLFLNEF